jgi:hypothetical protein
MTSLQKRRANRLNAQRSSGPKTEAGRTIASLNSVKHGLSQPIDPLTSGLDTSGLAGLLREDGLDALQAHDLVIKILDYERNLAHQLKIFQGWQEPGLELTPAVVDAKARERFPEIDMLDEMIQDELFFKGRVSTKDVKKVARIKEGMCRDWTKLHNRQMRTAARDANNATRYLKRSSNQLIKSLKALGDA